MMQVLLWIILHSTRLHGEHSTPLINPSRQRLIMIPTEDLVCDGNKEYMEVKTKCRKHNTIIEFMIYTSTNTIQYLFRKET